MGKQNRSAWPRGANEGWCTSFLLYGTMLVVLGTGLELAVLGRELCYSGFLQK